MQPNQLRERTLVERVEKTVTTANTGADEMTSANVRNWMECVRSRKTPNASIEAGYSHSIALCMAIAAMHTGQKATFDDAKQEVVVGCGTPSQSSAR
jgi:predicted YcjX-like family ATPase